MKMPPVVGYGYFLESPIPIFQTSKGNGNWFKKSGARKIEGGIKSHLFYDGIVLQDPRRQTTTVYHFC